MFVSDEELDLLGYAVMRSIREQRQILSAIMRERRERKNAGETNVQAWKAPAFNRSVERIERLQKVAELIDTVPAVQDPPTD